MRPIDADYLLNGGLKGRGAVHEGNYVYVPLVDVIKSVKNAPTLEIKTVRNGRWIKTKLGMVCSDCAQPPIKMDTGTYWIGDYAPPYCPNCGAKMAERKEEDDG